MADDRNVDSAAVGPIDAHRRSGRWTRRLRGWPGAERWLPILRILRRITRLDRTVEEQARLLQVGAFMEWIPHAPLHTQPLVSVILPTRDRCALLARAIASVKQQTYPHWELLIADDGSSDGTAAYLGGLQEPQVRTLRAPGAGVAAARNVALGEARGDLVVYLDDDNIMHPQWIKSVVWGFEFRPQTRVLYGAFLVDDPARIDPRGGGELPKLFFHDYDHRAVARDNVADIGCIAHRNGLPEARFDESLREMADWELFLRLTRDAPPLALPAISCFYTTDAPGRLSHGPTHQTDLRAVRERHRR